MVASDHWQLRLRQHCDALKRIAGLFGEQFVSSPSFLGLTIKSNEFLIPSPISDPQMSQSCSPPLPHSGSTRSRSTSPVLQHPPPSALSSASSGSSSSSPSSSSSSNHIDLRALFAESIHPSAASSSSSPISDIFELNEREKLIVSLEHNGNGQQSLLLKRLSNRPTQFSCWKSTPVSAPIFSVCLSRDNRILASGHYERDNSVRLWEIPSFESSSSPLRPLTALEGHTKQVSCLAFCPSQSQAHILASASMDGHIRIWDTRTHQCIQTLTGHERPVWGICFSPDSSTIFSSGHDSKIRIWKMQRPSVSNTLVSVPVEQRWTCTSVIDAGMTLGQLQISPDGSSIFCINASGGEPRVLVYSVHNDNSDSSTRLVLEADIETEHTDVLSGVAVSSNGSHFATSCHGGSVCVYDCDSSSNIYTLKGKIDAHESPCWSVAFIPTVGDSSADCSNSESPSDFLVSCGADKKLYVWDLTTMKRVQSLEGHRKTVYSATFSSDSSFMISGSQDDTLRLWRSAEGSTLSTDLHKQILPFDDSDAVRFVKQDKADDAFPHVICCRRAEGNLCLLIIDSESDMESPIAAEDVERIDIPPGMTRPSLRALLEHKGDVLLYEIFDETEFSACPSIFAGKAAPLYKTKIEANDVLPREPSKNEFSDSSSQVMKVYIPYVEKLESLLDDICAQHDMVLQAQQNQLLQQLSSIHSELGSSVLLLPTTKNDLIDFGRLHVEKESMCADGSRALICKFTPSPSSSVFCPAEEACIAIHVPGNFARLAVGNQQINSINPDENAALQEEKRKWNGFVNCNVLRTFGHTVYKNQEGHEFIGIVQQHCAAGNLQDLIQQRKSSGQVLTEKEVFCFAFQIATGLSALIGSFGQNFGSLKTANVRLHLMERCQLHVAKIGGVGAPSIALINDPLFVEEMDRYSAPELIADLSEEEEEASGSEKACNKWNSSVARHIWAIGLILYEMRTGSAPYARFKDQAKMIFAIGSGKPPGDLPPSEEWLESLYCDCVVVDPEARLRNFSGELQPFDAILAKLKAAHPEWTRELQSLLVQFFRSETRNPLL